MKYTNYTFYLAHPHQFLKNDLVNNLRFGRKHAKKKRSIAVIWWTKCHMRAFDMRIMHNVHARTHERIQEQATPIVKYSKTLLYSQLVHGKTWHRRLTSPWAAALGSFGSLTLRLTWARTWKLKTFSTRTSNVKLTSFGARNEMTNMNMCDYLNL